MLANFYDFFGTDTFCVGDTSVVDSYPAGASPYGALDMAGNVAEWVNDWYDMNYYSSSPGNNPLGPATGDNRAVRGGWWSSLQALLRVAWRYWWHPEPGFFGLGFRCARSD